MTAQEDPHEETALEVWGTAQTGGPVAITVARQMLCTNGKKATHSFFTQLLEAPLIDQETAELLGTPYAAVNWHPDQCSFPKKRLSLERNMPHVHVLWRNPGGMWLRALVSQRDQLEFWLEQASGYRRLRAALQETAKHLLAARVLDGWRPEWMRRHVPTWRLTRATHNLDIGSVAGQQYTPTVDFRLGGLLVRVPVTDAVTRIWHPAVARTLHPITGSLRYDHGADGSEWPTDEEFAEEQEQCQAELESVCVGRSAAEVRELEISPVLADLRGFRERWFASHDQIFKVGQVFL